MAYCRWGTGSVVYVYPSHKGLVCCACTLQPSGSEFVCLKRTEMIEHLATHALSGDAVPEHAFARLKEELASVGDDYIPVDI